MKARVIDAAAVTSLASVCIVVAGTAWAAPSVSIMGPDTITIGPGGAPLGVCLSATVSGATSVLWTKAPFTAVGIAYDPVIFPVFTSRFGRPFDPSDPVEGLIPSGPHSVDFATPNAASTCVTFDVATHALVSGGFFDPMVEPGRRHPDLDMGVPYDLGNDNFEGAYLITVTATNSAGATDSDSVIVNVRTDEDPSELGVDDDQVPPRDSAGREGADPASDHTFLESAGIDDEDVAKAYYNTIDPDDERTTQADWEEVNGFNDPLNTVIEANGYFDRGTLGFGRSIKMVVDQRDGYEGNIAFTTLNHLSAAAALGDPNVMPPIPPFDPVSIVNMEYSSVEPGGDRIVKFFVFADNDFDGVDERQTGSNFEGRGTKFLPALCFACHGGDDDAKDLDADDDYPDDGETNGTFLAFDTSTMEFSNEQPLANLEPFFKMLNEGVLETDPSRATRALIAALYGGPGLPRDTQDTDFVPETWVDAGQADLYLDVIVPSCRICHTTSDSKILDIEWVMDNAENMREEVFHELKMPNSLPTYNRFWLSTDPYQPKLLSDRLADFGSPVP